MKAYLNLEINDKPSMEIILHGQPKPTQLIGFKTFLFDEHSFAHIFYLSMQIGDSDIRKKLYEFANDHKLSLFEQHELYSIDEQELMRLFEYCFSKNRLQDCISRSVKTAIENLKLKIERVTKNLVPLGDDGNIPRNKLDGEYLMSMEIKKRKDDINIEKSLYDEHEKPIPKSNKDLDYKIIFLENKMKEQDKTIKNLMEQLESNENKLKEIVNKNIKIRNENKTFQKKLKEVEHKLIEKETLVRDQEKNNEEKDELIKTLREECRDLVRKVHLLENSKRKPNEIPNYQKENSKEDASKVSLNDTIEFFKAAKNGDYLKIKALAIKNARNDSGHTPMHFAASSGNVEAVIALEELGYGIDEKDNNGTTPIEWAKGKAFHYLNIHT